jgi:hypothetical protein
MSPRQIFGGLLAIVLLVLFLFLLWRAFQVAGAVILCGSDASCLDAARARFLSSMEGGLNTIGGLVSAIVIAELAITKPTEVPAARLFAAANAPPAVSAQRPLLSPTLACCCTANTTCKARSSPEPWRVTARGSGALSPEARPHTDLLPLRDSKPCYSLRVKTSRP